MDRVIPSPRSPQLRVYPLNVLPYDLELTPTGGQINQNGFLNVKQNVFSATPRQSRFQLHLIMPRRVAALKTFCFTSRPRPQGRFPPVRALFLGWAECGLKTRILLYRSLPHRQAMGVGVLNTASTHVCCAVDRLKSAGLAALFHTNHP